MRPLQIEIEGFGCYRSPTVVSFDGADLFVLAGPTGAGKSTVIDAMIFALYGSVPRLKDKRAVKSVIAQGMTEARVRLTFRARGNTYTATRVVRLVGGTKEARLETVDGRSLASGKAPVTEEVTRLLGLGYDHFIQCVVLPQGAFQELLHANPAERQKLLVDLLDIGLYGDLRKRANRMASEAATEQHLLEGQLADIPATATEQVRQEHLERERRLTAFAAELHDEATTIAQIKERGTEARRRSDEANDRLARLRAVRAPDGIGALATAIDQASARASSAAQVLEAARAHEAALVATGESLPELAAVTSALEAHATCASAQAQIEATTDTAREASDRVDAARDELEAAVAAETAAESHLQQARTAERAADLAATLDPGDACPVCGGIVGDAHDPPTSKTIEDATAALRQAKERVADRRSALTEAERAATRTAADLEAATRAREAAAAKVGALEGPLAGSVDDLAALRQEIGAHREQLSAARSATAAATRAATDAVAEADRLAEQRRQAREAVSAARDTIADTSPPSLGDDLAVDEAWQRLTDFAARATDEVEELVQRAAADLAQVTDDYRALAASQLQRARALGLEGASIEDLPTRVMRAASDSAAAATRVEEHLRRRDDLAKRLTDTTRVQQLAHGLSIELDHRHFQQWLLNRALRGITRRASVVLGELSRGAFGLALADDNTFDVIDHRNADERRPVRTLSGGETFLASLALALAMSEQVVDIAADGAARVESLFLDEGFGTLDPDTLDVVATALEELGASGRMVGVITHVRDLADALPVRFEVRRTGNASTIERIDV